MGYHDSEVEPLLFDLVTSFLPIDVVQSPYLLSFLFNTLPAIEVKHIEQQEYGILLYLIDYVVMELFKDVLLCIHEFFLYLKN